MNQVKEYSLKLIEAATKGDCEAGLHFLSKPVDVNYRSDFLDRPPLMLATGYRHEVFARMLMSHPSLDLSIKDCYEIDTAELARSVGLHHLANDIEYMIALKRNSERLLKPRIEPEI